MADQQELMDIFDQMDRDGDRILTKAEISSFLLSRNFNKKFIEEFLATFDSDSDGRVTEAEYRQKAGPDAKWREEWYQIFQKFDKDGSGFIDEHELPQLMVEIGSKTTYSPEQFRRWIAEHDANKDGKISYPEFLNWVRGAK
uniref:Calmodulin n=1 Tax=Macrostomum lignano TaxID=282301 RepID=A0A1I8G483_9PLAT